MDTGATVWTVRRHGASHPGEEGARTLGRSSPSARPDSGRT